MAQNNLGCFSDYVRHVVEELVEELGFENYKLIIVPGSEQGDNYCGTISKVTVTGQSKSSKHQTLNLIVKSAPTNELSRSLLPIHAAYDREVYVYNKLLPELQKIQEEKGISTPLGCFAKLHAATLKDANEALIMEDMKELGYTMLNSRKPLDYDHTLLVLKEYGRLHALSYALRDQKPTLFRKLVDDTQDTFFNSLGNFRRESEGLQTSMACALTALDPIAHRVAYKKFENFLGRRYGAIKFVLDCDAAEEYAVIGHGDSWINNMLFKYEESATSGPPSAVCFLDWQLSRAGSPALDVSYCMFACTDKKLRAQHYNTFLQEYYNSLSSFLRELGSNPDELFPFDVLQEHMKKFSVYGLYMSIIIFYLITNDSKDILNLQTVTVKGGSKNLEYFRERVKHNILDFVDYGYDL